MSFDDLLPVLNRVFSEHRNFNENTTWQDVEEWDSIGHLNLIVELEDVFNVNFSEEEIEGIKSVREIVTAIQNHMNENR